MEVFVCSINFVYYFMAKYPLRTDINHVIYVRYKNKSRDMHDVRYKHNSRDLCPNHVIYSSK